MGISNLENGYYKFISKTTFCWEPNVVGNLSWDLVEVKFEREVSKKAFLIFESSVFEINDF